MTAIFKILIPEQWAQFEETQIFKGALIDLSDGYIHFSTAAQAQETADKHFTGIDEIIMVRVDVNNLPKRLSGALKWETSRGGDLFPHLYAALPMSAVKAHRVYKRGADGFDLSDLETL